jgi:hypothetical protein
MGSAPTRLRCYRPIVNDAVKDEYDFPKGERGKLYRPDGTLKAFLTPRAQARGVSLSQLVNTLVKKDTELIEAAK